MDGSAGAAAGAEAKLGLVVHRRSGKNVLSNVIVRFYLGDPDNGGTAIGDGRIPLLSRARRPARRQCAWTPPQEGDYEIYAVIDPDGAVAEVREDNNVVHRTVTALRPHNRSACAPRRRIHRGRCRSGNRGYDRNPPRRGQ